MLAFAQQVEFVSQVSACHANASLTFLNRRQEHKCEACVTKAFVYARDNGGKALHRKSLVAIHRTSHETQTDEEGTILDYACFVCGELFHKSKQAQNHQWKHKNPKPDRKEQRRLVAQQTGKGWAAELTRELGNGLTGRESDRQRHHDFGESYADREVRARVSSSHVVFSACSGCVTMPRLLSMPGICLAMALCLTAQILSRRLRNGGAVTGLRQFD